MSFEGGQHYTMSLEILQQITIFHDIPQHFTHNTLEVR
jgi:hypothetical protein